MCYRATEEAYRLSFDYSQKIQVIEVGTNREGQGES